MRLVLFMLAVLGMDYFYPCELEKGWKGIRVFESDRAAVEKALGRKPAEGDEVESRFLTDEASIKVLYSSGECISDSLTGGFNAPKGLVIQDEVVPRDNLALDRLKLDVTHYSRWEDTHTRGVVWYYNEQAAIRISTNKVGRDKVEYVRTIYFERSRQQEAKFACSKKAG